MPQKLATTSNESDKLITVSIKSEKPHSGGIPRVRLAGVRWHTDDENRPRSGADASNGHVDESKDSADALNTSSSTETAGISCGDSADTHLGPGGTKRAIDSAKGFGSRTDSAQHCK